MRTGNVLDVFNSSKHSGVIVHFNQYHVKTGDFDKTFQRLFRMLWKCMNMSIFVASKKDVEDVDRFRKLKMIKEMFCLSGDFFFVL